MSNKDKGHPFSGFSGFSSSFSSDPMTKANHPKAEDSDVSMDVMDGRGPNQYKRHWMEFQTAKAFLLLLWWWVHVWQGVALSCKATKGTAGTRERRWRATTIAHVCSSALVWSSYSWYCSLGLFSYFLSYFCCFFWRSSWTLWHRLNHHNNR